MGPLKVAPPQPKSWERPWVNLASSPTIHYRKRRNETPRLFAFGGLLAARSTPHLRVMSVSFFGFYFDPIPCKHCGDAGHPAGKFGRPSCPPCGGACQVGGSGIDPGYMSRKIRKFRTDKFDTIKTRKFDSYKRLASRLYELHE